METTFEQIATFLTGFIFGFAFKEIAEILHSYTKRFQSRIEEGL